MIIGQTVLSGIEGLDETYYSPWFGRGGSGAEFVMDILAISSGCVVTFTVETKSSEDDNQSASVTSVLTSSSLSTVAQHGLKAGTDVAGSLIGSSASGLQELVRFRYDVSSSGSTQEWVHFRMLNPAWIGDGA